MFNEVAKKTPILPISIYISVCLSIENETILSEVGVQKGDPAEPFLFCLNVQLILMELTSKLNAWYLDDGTLRRTPDSVLADFKILIEKCRKLWLNINFENCEIFCLFII